MTLSSTLRNGPQNTDAHSSHTSHQFSPIVRTNKSECSPGRKLISTGSSSQKMKKISSLRAIFKESFHEILRDGILGHLLHDAQHHIESLELNQLLDDLHVASSP